MRVIKGGKSRFREREDEPREVYQAFDDDVFGFELIWLCVLAQAVSDLISKNIREADNVRRWLDTRQCHLACSLAGMTYDSYKNLIDRALAEGVTHFNVATLHEKFKTSQKKRPRRSKYAPL